MCPGDLRSDFWIGLAFPCSSLPLFSHVGSLGARPVLPVTLFTLFAPSGGKEGAEGAEVAHGFYVLAATDRDEAVKLASMIPASTVEVRRLAGISGL